MLKMRNWDGLTILYRDSATDQSDMAQMDWMKSGWFWRTFAEVIRREPINLIVDVGAHMGSFSLPAIVEARRHLPAARLVAFEPEEESHNLLVANVHLNHLSHLVEILNLGVGATDGATELQISSEGWGHSTHANQSSDVNPMTGTSRTVRTVCLTTLLTRTGLPADADVDFLKFNAEGAEFAFFSGAPAPEVRRIRHMVAELHMDLVRGASLPVFLDYWHAAGFETETELTVHALTTFSTPSTR